MVANAPLRNMRWEDVLSRHPTHCVGYGYPTCTQRPVTERALVTDTPHDPNALRWLLVCDADDAIDDLAASAGEFEFAFVVNLHHQNKGVL